MTSNDYDQIFVDQDNDALYFKKDGDSHAERVRLIRISDMINLPKLPELKPVSGAQLIRTWSSLNSEDVFDKTNANWQALITDMENIETNNQLIYQWCNQLIQILKLALQQIDVDATQNLSDGVYSKFDVDEKIKSLTDNIKQFEDRVKNGYQTNNYDNPSFIGDGDQADIADVLHQLAEITNEEEEDF